MTRWLLPAILLVVGAGCGCKADPSKSEAAGQGSAAPTGSVPLPAPVASGLPGDLSKVSQVVNPKAEKAYSGPTATVRGTITVTGDAAPALPKVIEKISAECLAARDVYGKPFREGEGRGLADALVAVTGYQGYVPDPEPVVKLDVKDCNWGPRTIALTFGQRIDALSRDSRSYVPELLGSGMKSQLVATPFSKGTSSLYPPAPGRYVLIDDLRLFMTAEVLVLKYATHDVTGLDGKYEIKNIPPGKVTVSAFHPMIGATAQKEVELKAGDALTVDLSLGFAAQKYLEELEREEKSASAAASASAKPAAPSPSAAH